MAECVLTKAGGGTDLDAVTATAADIVAPNVIVGQDGEPITGTMVDRGNWNSTELAAGASVTIPAGKHGGGGKVTAKSLAAQTGGATATDQYVKSGLTYWKDGVKRTGTMTVSSVVSFSVAAYSTSQVLATWKNPAKGPYSGVAICAKTGGYPANINDGRVYTGIGNNSTLNGTSSQAIGGLAAGTTYYFRIWVYCTASSGDMYSGYLQTTCAPTAHGRAAFTASGSWTVPANVRYINIHCTGGGGGGIYKQNTQQFNTYYLGCGGAGGYTTYKNNISVLPGQVITFIVGAGGKGGLSTGGYTGGISSASLGTTTLCATNTQGSPSRNGGSGGGGSAKSGGNYTYDADSNAAKGGANGGNGFGTDAGTGQGLTTREFGLPSGTLYSGGGGGHARNKTTTRPAGGDGGGGRGSTADGTYTNPPTAGSAGTGGGGGAGGGSSDTDYWTGAAGGCGNVIITW